MDAIPDQFSLSQKARLALSVFIIYWPIRLYLNIYAISWPFLLGVLPLWAIEIPLTIFFFFCWISLAQGLLNRFQLWSGALTNTWTQLGLLVVASVMAVLFNVVFNEIRTGLDDALEPRSSVANQRMNGGGVPSQWRRRGGSDQRQRMNTGITVMAMLSAFYLVVNRRSNNRMRQLEVKAERMEKETAQAQFMALKN